MYFYIYVFLFLCMFCSVYSVSIVFLYALFICKRVLYYCHRVPTQLQLANIYSYHHQISQKSVGLDPCWCMLQRDRRPWRSLHALFVTMWKCFLRSCTSSNLRNPHLSCSISLRWHYCSSDFQL